MASLCPPPRPPFSLDAVGGGGGGKETEEYSPEPRGLPLATSRRAAEASGGDGGTWGPPGRAEWSVPRRGPPRPRRPALATLSHNTSQSAVPRVDYSAAFVGRAWLPARRPNNKQFPLVRAGGFRSSQKGSRCMLANIFINWKEGQGARGGGREGAAAGAGSLTFHPQLLHVGLEISCL